MKSRKIKRINARLPVIVAVYEKDISDTIYSETITISETGLSLRANIRLDMSLDVVLTIFLTDNITNYVAYDVSFITCKGEVIYNSSDFQSGCDSYIIGMTIIDVKHEDKLLLKKFLNNKNYSKNAYKGNKRKDKRVDTILPVIVLKKGSFSVDGTDYAQIKNISESGAYFISQNKFSLHEEVPLRIFLPLIHIEFNSKMDTILTCNARIVRLEHIESGKRGTDNPMLGMGLEFIDMGGEDKSRLKEFIKFS